MFFLLLNRHWWVWGRQAVCLRPLHQYRRLLPVPVLPRIPAHTGRQPLWRHELFNKPCILIVFTWTQYAFIYHLKLNRQHPNKVWLSLVSTRSLINFVTPRHILHIPTLFLFPSLQISTSVRGHQTVRGAAVSTIWAHTTVSARRATRWSEAGDAKVSVFKSLRSNFH